MNMKTMMMAALLLAAQASSQALAQTNDPTTSYIDAGFAAMDANHDGKVTRAEFDVFMRARLARQAVAFNGAFAKLDANGDSRITLKEAAANPLLQQHFGEVDTNHDGFVTKDELRAAMLKAQAHDSGLS